jgi:hypothetical protein
MTIYVTADRIGDVATSEDVTRLVEILREKGWDAVAAEGRNEFDSEEDEEKFGEDWDAALDIMGKEWAEA